MQRTVVLWNRNLQMTAFIIIVFAVSQLLIHGTHSCHNLNLQAADIVMVTSAVLVSRSVVCAFFLFFQFATLLRLNFS